MIITSTNARGSYRCLWKNSPCHAISQQKLPSSPWSGAPRAYIRKGLLIRRSIFFTDTGASRASECNRRHGTAAGLGREPIIRRIIRRRRRRTNTNTILIISLIITRNIIIRRDLSAQLKQHHGTNVSTRVHMCTCTRTHLSTYKCTNVHTYTRTSAYIHIPLYIHTSIHPYIQTSRHTDIHTPIHPYIQTSRHPDIQAYRHPGIQTSIHPYIYTSIHPHIRTSTETQIHRWKGKEDLCSTILANKQTIIPVSVNKNTPPEKKALGKTNSKNTKSGTGEQFMMFLCKAKARKKGGWFVRRRR